MTPQPRHRDTGAPVRIALLGVGNVGRAVLTRLATWSGGDDAPVELAYLADSRRAYCPVRAIGRPMALQPAGPARSLEDLAPEHGLRAPWVIVDATASDAVAARHARWLAGGAHVVTACKLGQGAALARWRDIRAGCATGGTCYGDRATVGAGLPLLETLRALQAGGDRIHAMAGVLSGSLAWLLDRYDGRRPFSALVEEARVAGLTEPDPREDLSGADVRRKLLILARAAGVALDEDDVRVVPLATALPGRSDAALQAQLDDARRRDARLQFVGRLHCREGRWHARAGVEVLEADDPLAAGRGTDNRLAIWSDRYRERPLLIQGPGAGAGVTAAALLDDVLGIARQAGATRAMVTPAPARTPVSLPA